MKRILAINPGSTSTKLAIYEDDRQVWKKSVYHPMEDLKRFHHINEQYEYRRNHITEALRKAEISLDFDAVISRGGLLKPTQGGVYLIDERIKNDLWNSSMEHASNLGAWIADEIARSIGCPSYIADPVVTDELSDIARITGIPEIPRISIFHALNSRAVSRRYAAQTGKKYEEMNLIVAHLGGGISVSAHQYGKVIDVNNALNGEGPFSPERTGGVTALTMAKMCFSGEYTYDQIKRMIVGEGGAVAHLGTNDFFKVEDDYKAGDPATIRFVDSLAYHVAKSIGGLAAAVSGKVDAIILTGGIAYYKHLCDMIAERVGFLAPVVHYPGEDEMQALAECAEMVLNGETSARIYE